MTSITVRHNFETAHRLPHLGGKCTNLHGHSWWAHVTITGDLDDTGTVMDFGAAKAAIRQWIDANLDHGAMLGATDPLVPALLADGTKLFRFGTGEEWGKERHAADLPYPTVELVAQLLGRVAQHLLAPINPWVRVTRVRVTETHVNAAEWVAGD